MRPDRYFTESRGSVQFVDVLLVFITLVGTLVLAPYYSKFTAMVSADADPFSALLLQLVLPTLLLALLLSAGVSARGSR